MIVGIFFILLLLDVALEDGCGKSIDDSNGQHKSTEILWNIPTFQCLSHKIYFAPLAEKFKIIQNEDDSFRGQKIAILYDPGDFPAILKDGDKSVLRNGGVPQEGNLTKHLEIFEDILEELIPDYDFAGIGVIDFESWRPIFRQNFGVLAEYKTLSVSVEKKKHPLWPNPWLEKEAKRQFEYHAHQFMERTLFVAKRLRPNATWGYYAYPQCFNMSPNNMKRECPKEVVVENDSEDWLFELSDNLYPSLYLGSLKLNSRNKMELIEGRIDEAKRIQQRLAARKNLNIMPYFWYKYHDTKQFLTKEDLFNSFTVLSSYNTDGLVLWGSSSDVNTKQNCLQLYEYIKDVLGPLLIHFFN